MTNSHPIAVLIGSFLVTNGRRWDQVSNFSLIDYLDRERRERQPSVGKCVWVRLDANERQPAMESDEINRWSRHRRPPKTNGKEEMRRFVSD